MKTIEQNSMQTRRFDIDWLRVIAIGLLLIYHIGIGFQPWGVFIQFIQNNQPLESLWISMSMLNIWRIPLLFFVSGMGVRYAMKKRNWKQLMLERSKRIFLPFLFGFFFIVPVHVFVWQRYYSQEMLYSPGAGHLWFLGNIFIYVILLAPVFFWLKNNQNGRINRWLIRIFAHPAGLILIVSAFCLEALWVKPELYEAFAMSLHGFIVGMLGFIFGFFIVQTGQACWSNLLKGRWIFLSVAVTLYVLRMFIFKGMVPEYVLPVESCSWIFTVFGFGYKYLNRPGSKLRYLSQAAYPVYIIHMIVLYVASYFIMPMGIAAWLKFVLVVGITFTGCFLIYEFVIRRIGLIRPLFGLKVTPHSTSPANQIIRSLENARISNFSIQKKNSSIQENGPRLQMRK